MLAVQANESTIISAPVKRNRTLEVTTQRLAIHDSKNIKLNIALSDVRSITPLKKDKIRIQFYSEKYLSNGNTIAQRKYADYTLDNSEFSAHQICHKIKQEYERISTWSKNEHGMLIMQPHEHVVGVFNGTKTNQGDGLFYITNVGVALETDHGVVYDVSYDKIKLFTRIKNNKIRIVWEEHGTMFKEFKFDFIIGKKLNRDGVMKMLNDAFQGYRKKTGFRFVQLEQKFSKISPDEMYTLATSENPEFEEYLKLHVSHTFGFISHWFQKDDKEIICACKITGIPIELIKDIPDNEMQQRRDALQYETKYLKYLDLLKTHTDELDRMEKQCSNVSDLKRVQNTKEYVEISKAIDKLKEENSDCIDLEKSSQKFVLASLLSYDRRVTIIYKEWKKNNLLVNFKDEYSDTWIEYMLEKLNNSKGKNPVIGSATCYDQLQDGIKERDRNKATLDMFLKPENIPENDIYNNCWYDETMKIWYVFNDNLDDTLQQVAISDPDHSQRMCGRRAWGFSDDMVEKYCGFPAIKVKLREKDLSLYVTTDRTTGKDITIPDPGTVPRILPILKEEDITKEMVEKRGLYAYDIAGFRFSCGSDGRIGFMTPKMYDLYHKRFGITTHDLSERVRRSLFVCDTGLVPYDGIPA